MFLKYKNTYETYLLTGDYEGAEMQLTKIENEIMKDLGIVSIYKQIETDKQINDIDIQKERLEIEKLKQGTEEDKKVEIKIIGVD